LLEPPHRGVDVQRRQRAIGHELIEDLPRDRFQRRVVRGFPSSGHRHSMLRPAHKIPYTPPRYASPTKFLTLPESFFVTPFGLFAVLDSFALYRPLVSLFRTSCDHSGSLTVVFQFHAVVRACSFAFWIFSGCTRFHALRAGGSVRNFVSGVL